METKSGGLTKLEGDDHTTYKGYKLYNSKDVLKTPSEFVNEYKKSYKFADVANKSILMIISAVNTRMMLFRLKRKRLRMKIFLYPKSMTVLKMTELIKAFHRNRFQTKQMFFLVILLNLISVLNLIIKLTTFLFQICKLPKLLTIITAYLTLA